MINSESIDAEVSSIGEIIGEVSSLNQIEGELNITSSSTSTEIKLQEKSVTPTTEQQNIRPDVNYDGLGKVVVEAVDSSIDPDIKASNIKKGIDILGVTGTMEEYTEPVLQAKSVTPKTSSQTIKPDSNYDGLSSVTVSAVTSSIDSDIVAGNIKKGVNILGVTGTLEQETEPVLQSKTATPKTSSQTITPDSGYDGLSSVSINAVDNSIDSNIVASNIKSGVTILGVEGTLEEGTTEDLSSELTEQNTLLNTQETKIDDIILALQNKTAGGSSEITLQEKTVTPTTSQQNVIADANYNGLSKVIVEGVTSSIDSNIKASNIKNGVSILGITGTLEEGTEPSLQSKTVTPTTSSQTIKPDSSYDGLSSVTVNAVSSSIDSNIKSSNIKSGVSILGVTGTLDEGITPTGTKGITSNGTYDVTNYASVNVNVPTSGGATTYDIGVFSFDVSEENYYVPSTAYGGQEVALVCNNEYYVSVSNSSNEHLTINTRNINDTTKIITFIMPNEDVGIFISLE